MNILLISNNIDLVKNIKRSYPDSSIKVIIDSYETKESANICKKVTNTSGGISIICENHVSMYKTVTSFPNKCFLEFYESEYDFTKGHEIEEISEKLYLWGMNELVPFVVRFFSRAESLNYKYTKCNVSTIVYSEMCSEVGYEETNRYFSSLLGIDDFIVLNSYDNIFFQAITDKESTVDLNELTSTEFKEHVKGLNYICSSSFLNPKAVDAVNSSDLIIISTKNFWSSVYPILDYLDFYTIINSSSAKKILLKESDDVLCKDCLETVSRIGLNLSDFNILESDNEISDKSVSKILKTYYGINNINNFNNILFDFDETLWSCDLEQEAVLVDIILRMMNNLKNATIVSSNSYENLRTKIAKVYGANLDNFNVNIWADANSCLYLHNELVAVISDLIIQGDPQPLIQHFLETYRLNCSSDNTNILTCLKIRPLSQLDQCLLSNYLNDFLLEAAGLTDCCAAPSGSNTVNIVNKKNNKSCVLPYINNDYSKILYIGDETSFMNDSQLSNLCGHAIHTKDIKEIPLVIRLLKE